MAACDVFVLASAWEGLPVAMMEAAALGLPIVATRVGGVAENLDEADAVLVPPRDPVALAAALEPLVTDHRRRAELSTAARSAAARFDVRRAMETLTARYEQLADAPPSHGPPWAQVASAPRRRARTAAGDGRRPRPDPGAPRRVARLERRAATASCSRGSTSATRSGPRQGGWSSLMAPSSPSACSCAGRSGGAFHTAGRARRRHGDASGAPRPRSVHGADVARVGGVPGRRGCLRLQHAERRQSARLPQVGLAGGRSTRRRGAVQPCPRPRLRRP